MLDFPVARYLPVSITIEDRDTRERSRLKVGIDAVPDAYAHPRQASVRDVVERATPSGCELVSVSDEDGTLVHHQDLPRLPPLDRVAEVVQALLDAVPEDFDHRVEKEAKRIIEALRSPR